MIQFDKIRRLHIELSTRCNSTCPDCPRNLRGIENDYRGQEIYIAANGDVSPCCWTGFYPAYKTSYSNRQLAEIVKENNALIYGLEHSVQWFNALAETWKIPSVKQGRIKACNDTCGYDC